MSPSPESRLAKRTWRPQPCRGPGILRLILLVTSVMVLAACGPSAPTPEGVSVQTALPTPTAEPTFTPAPSPTKMPQPSPTATPAEPTPTPTPESVVLSGRILDQGTNQPVAGATVRVGAASATTDPEGRYTLTGLPPGQFVLSVTHPDYDPGLSSIFTLAAGQEHSLDLALYAPDTSPYPKDPMLTNPLDPNGASTAEDAERLARLQGLTGEVVDIQETELSGEYLVNYKIDDEVRAAMAELNHGVWELTDDMGRAWWIIKVCGNLASLLPTEMPVATPQPQAISLMVITNVDELAVRACASNECEAIATLARETRMEVTGCLADRSWCQVRLAGGGIGWCSRAQVRFVAAMAGVPEVKAILPTPMPGAAGAGKIAFASDRDHLDENESHRPHELYVMNPDGGQQTRITTKGFPISGSPDFLDWLPDLDQVFYWYSKLYLGVINLSDGSVVPWQFPVSHDGSYIDPSPDGGRLAYGHRSNSTTSNIFVVNTDGTNLIQLTDSPEGVIVCCPSWSPNGDRLAFAIQDSRQGVQHSLWTMNADGSGEVELAEVPLREIAWSPDGDKIAFECRIPGTTQSAHLDICVINTDGTNLESLTHFESSQEAWNPSWSPDGKQIAFEVWTVRSAGDEKQIYVINADGTGLTQLTFEGNNCCPAWSR